MTDYEKDYDFCGWAVVDNMAVSVMDDGTIPVVKPGALSNEFAAKIPICWNHDFQDPSMIVGWGILKPVEGGIYFLWQTKLRFSERPRIYQMDS